MRSHSRSRSRSSEEPSEEPSEDLVVEKPHGELKTTSQPFASSSSSGLPKADLSCTVFRPSSEGDDLIADKIDNKIGKIADADDLNADKINKIDKNSKIADPHTLHGRSSDSSDPKDPMGLVGGTETEIKEEKCGIALSLPDSMDDEVSMRYAETQIEDSQGEILLDHLVSFLVFDILYVCYLFRLCMYYLS